MKKKHERITSRHHSYAWPAALTQCGLMTPYGDINLSQLWLRQWLVAWQHQAITWTNVDLLSVRSNDNHLRAISQVIPEPLIMKTSLKLTYLRHPSNTRGRWVKQIKFVTALNKLYPRKDRSSTTRWFHYYLWICFLMSSMANKLWDEINYPYPNLNGVTNEVWERISNSISYFIMDVISYPCKDWS